MGATRHLRKEKRNQNKDEKFQGMEIEAKIKFVPRSHQEDARKSRTEANERGGKKEMGKEKLA